MVRRCSPATSCSSNSASAVLLGPFAMCTAFLCSDYYGPSAPPPGRQPTTSLPAVGLADRQGGGPGSGSHVHHQPFNGVGAQLFPCSLATVTPQAFTVASSLALTSNGRSRPPKRACTAVRPRSTRFEPATRLRGFHHWFLHSYTCRVAPAHCCAGAPSEPGVRLSPHRAQASLMARGQAEVQRFARREGSLDNERAPGGQRRHRPACRVAA